MIITTTSTLYCSSVSRSSSTQGSREGSPRPRSEDIPLEDIRRNMAAATPVTTQSQPSTSSQPLKVVTTSSEETSFISGEVPRYKRKGIVETI
ncbi:hypothetical protein RR48_07882 [Papilio machaon]|uniref:Uncharacterized protein n=1 Tax=Papilio machaon TaxID=76193 RepID=A0A194QTM8_PAPMA|nr:hypothetical protein RR48_07882 [Papilio machaon]